MVPQYEIRAFTRNRRGRWMRVKGFSLKEPDAYSAATEVWRLTHLEVPYAVEIRDLAAGRGPLVPLVSYEELLRRAGNPKQESIP